MQKLTFPFNISINPLKFSTDTQNIRSVIKEKDSNKLQSKWIVKIASSFQVWLILFVTFDCAPMGMAQAQFPTFNHAKDTSSMPPFPSPSHSVYQKQHPSLCRKIRYHPYKRHFPKRTQILLSNYPTQPPTRCYIIHNKNRLCCSILLLPIPCNIIVANLFNLPYSNIMHFVDHLFHSTALPLHKCS